MPATLAFPARKLIDNLDAIFFDFDGVLVDSVDIKARAFLSLFEAEPEPVRENILAYFYAFTGRSRQEKLAFVLENFLERSADKQEIGRLADEFRQASFRAVAACADITGAIELLDALPSRVKTFVVSGTPQSELIEIIAARKMPHEFSEVKGTPRLKEHNIADILKQHGLAAERCVMIGDGRVDQQAAAYNHVPFIGVVPEGKSSPFSEDTRVVRDLEALRSLLY